ncbi:MAG: rRNA maturation RNase YbeY [Weeksellaceae bacterium]|nr:rRNA maturation RNase YbeY [Weeksellaceae bacterium]
MIMFFSETNFETEAIESWKEWIESATRKEGFETDKINYIFCSDDQLLQINIEYLQHDYYTDVIGFQYSKGNKLSGDIYISIDRVRENATENLVSFEKELARVMIHGILHFMNYKDKNEAEVQQMRQAEDKHLACLDENY